MLIGGIEAGGTKMVCAIGDELGNIWSRKVIPTDIPEVTMPQMLSFFRNEKIEALGIGCFGPCNLDRKSKTYGYIMNSPKKNWQMTDFSGYFKDNLNIPIGFDTDVNAAALGEAWLGIGKEKEIVLYVTVGTGIGAGVCINGEPVHGMVHPEAGHISVQKRTDDLLDSVCSFHGNCAEGLACGRAVEKRLRIFKENGLSEEVAWDIEADYLAQLLATFILVYSPNQIVLWGGVMHQEHLFKRIRNKLLVKLCGYLEHPNLTPNGMEGYIAPPGLLENSGIIGAIQFGYKELMKLENDKQTCTK